jgi:hypothetical protein
MAAPPATVCCLKQLPLLLGVRTEVIGVRLVSVEAQLVPKLAVTQ